MLRSKLCVSFFYLINHKIKIRVFVGCICSTLNQSTGKSINSSPVTPVQRVHRQTGECWLPGWWTRPHHWDETLPSLNIQHTLINIYVKWQKRTIQKRKCSYNLFLFVIHKFFFQLLLQIPFPEKWKINVNKYRIQ